jgi:phosphoglucosamine mutase
VGDRYVGEEMSRIGADLGGEQSGHIIFLHFSSTADALLTAVMVLDIAARRAQPLSAIGHLMERFPQVLINVPVADKPEFWEIVPIRDAIREAQTALDGRGRISVRYSGTENLARVMAEASSEELARSHAQKVADAFHRTIGAPGND